MRAVHREASRLVAADANVASATQSESRSKDWSRVTRLAPGRKIVVEVQDGGAASHVFVRADDFELVVLNLSDPPLDAAVRRILQEVASTHPEYFVQVFAGLRFVQGDVHVAPDGVFLRDRKVAEVSDVVRRIPRPDVTAVKTPPQRRGSLIGAAIGAAGGFVLGLRSAMYFRYKQCGGSCGDEQALMALSLVGFPIAGALLGYQANPRMTQEVIYRP